MIFNQVVFCSTYIDQIDDFKENGKLFARKYNYIPFYKKYIFPVKEKAADLFKYVMYGRVLTTVGCLGLIGNFLSIIVFTRASMKSAAINFLLIGEQNSNTFLGNF